MIVTLGHPLRRRLCNTYVCTNGILSSTFQDLLDLLPCYDDYIEASIKQNFGSGCRGPTGMEPEFEENKRLQ